MTAKFCHNCAHSDDIEGRTDCLKYCQKIGCLVHGMSIGCKDHKKRKGEKK